MKISRTSASEKQDKFDNKSKKKRIGIQESSMQLGKLPPQALELEEVVLGALMLEKSALTAVIDILKPEIFYKEAHIKIYESMVMLFNKSEPVDLMTVTDQLRKNGTLEIAGGAYYIAKLTGRVNSTANIESHARIIIEQSIKRELIRISAEMQEDAFEDTKDVFELLDKTEQALFEISEFHIRKNYVNMQTLMLEAISEIEARKNHPDGLTGIPSGFNALDRVTAGWQKSELIIVAARPGMGKCLGKGTKVLMYDGTIKKVEDVNRGDQLMGDDSTPRNVFSLARGREKMYWVRQNNGLDYRVNESHILSLKKSKNEGKHKKGEILNIEIKNYLQKSDKFRSNYKGYKVSIEFESKKLPIEPYFLGLWLGDGYSYSIGITNQDTEVINYLDKYVDRFDLNLIEYGQTERFTNHTITKTQYEKQNFYALQELKKSDLPENKDIPQIYLSNSIENRLELLAGLIDSDSYYDDESNDYEIVQKNKKLAYQIKFLCDSLGFRTSIKEKTPSIKKNKHTSKVFFVRFSGDIHNIPVKIKHKKARVNKNIIDWHVTEINVEYDKVDDYYGFEIDGNHLFLLEDMTVTHNTAFIVSALRNAAVDFNIPVAIFSLEMSSIQLVNRMISGESELESDKIKKGNLVEHEWEQLVYRTNKLAQSPIFIDDTPALSILELRAKCRRLKAQHDVQVIVVDYLQLMSAGDISKTNSNREQEIGSISRALKSIAKELDVPVIALSQLSRAVETRGGDKRPKLSDLRESGSIEQDADIVMFLYRPEYYGFTQNEEGIPTTGMGEVIIAKHRNGSLENVQLKFISKYTKFTDMNEPMTGGDYGNNFPESDGSSKFSQGKSTIILPSKGNNLSDDDSNIETPSEDAPF